MTASAPSPIAASVVTPAGFEPGPPMTQEEVDEAIRLHSPILVAEVYEAARRAVENYGQKIARLDQKATTLLGAIGLSLTVALTYGSQLALAHTKGSVPGVVLLTFWIAAFVGICAGVLATVALFVRDHAEISDRAIFNAKELREADALEPADQASGLASYRRSVTLHLWLITKQREVKIRGKARAIRLAQGFFFAFLVLLLLVCVEIAKRMA